MNKVIPWWSKVFVKLLIGLTPFSYERVRNILTGNRGEMNSPDYAKNIFQKYSKEFLIHTRKFADGTLLELGPGGSLLTGFFAKAQGFKKCILIDVGDFASPDQKLYTSMAYLLPTVDREVFEKKLDEGAKIVEALKAINIYYYTSGIKSLEKIPPNSVDFSFSNAVLEHVRKKEFEKLLGCLLQVHKSGSISCHQVDYKDHLGGGLNNLRFPDKIWESRYFANDGFYTNRLRHSQVIGCAERAGFRVLKEELSLWDVLPVDQNLLATEFRTLDKRDLRIKGALISLQKPIRQ